MITSTVAEDHWLRPRSSCWESPRSKQGPLTVYTVYQLTADHDQVLACNGSPRTNTEIAMWIGSDSRLGDRVATAMCWKGYCQEVNLGSLKWLYLICWCNLSSDSLFCETRCYVHTHTGSGVILRGTSQFPCTQHNRSLAAATPFSLRTRALSASATKQPVANHVVKGYDPLAASIFPNNIHNHTNQTSGTRTYMFVYIRLWYYESAFRI